MRFGAVNVHPRRNEYAIGAEAPGGDTRHGRPDAELPRLVTGSADDASPARRSADNYGFSAQIGPVPLLDGSVEGVHVQMKNGARHYNPGGNFTIEALLKKICFENDT